MTCVFCEIVAGRAPASVVHEDEQVLAFMAIQPSAPGGCLIIPKAHIDHYTDILDALAERVALVAQRLGRRLRTRFPLERVG